MQKDVIAIIVNYGTAELALQAVSSLLKDGERILQIHVVDNASPTGDATRLAHEIQARRWSEFVTLHAEANNAGFGAGNNLVIDLVQGDPDCKCIFLLNPDAQIVGGAVSSLASFIDSNELVGAVGAKLSKPNIDGGLIPVSGAFRFPSLLSILIEAVSFGPLSRLFEHYSVPLDPCTGTQQVDWVAGAAVMFRLEALKKCGAFDPDFFLYFEEVELMHRFKRKGWEVWLYAEAQAVHVEGASTGVRSESRARRRPFYWYQSWAYYMLKTAGRFKAFLSAFLWILGVTVNKIICTLRGKPSIAPVGFFGDFIRHSLPILVGLNGHDQ